MGNRARAYAVGIAAVRLGAGVALGGAPIAFLRFEPSASGTSMPLLLRTVGIRDLAVGIGTASALRSGSKDNLRRWVSAGLLSDALDVVAGVASSRTTGFRGLASALIAAPMVWVGMCAISAIRESEPDWNEPA
jgi:hypothetical protein